MNGIRKKTSLLIVAAVLSLSSCGGDNSANNGNFSNPLDVSRFNDRYTYTVNPGSDGIIADLESEDPLSYDDTISIGKYVWDDSLPLAGYYENGTITMEDAVRTDVKTDYGQGYPIVSIGNNCFLGAADVTGIRLSVNITSIGDNAFSGLSNLTSLNIPDLTELSYIGDGALSGIPWYQTYYDSMAGKPIIFGHVLYAFSGTLTSGSYAVPDGIEEIAPEAFKNQANLTSISFPSSLTKIGANAFSGTGLSSVSVPSSVTSIGDEAFASCPNLITADLGKADLGMNVLSGDGNITGLAYSGGRTAAELFDGADMTKISSVSLKGEAVTDNALNGLTGLVSLDLTGVRTIGAGAFGNLPLIATVSGTDSLQYMADDSLTSSAWYAALADGPIYLGTAFLGFKGSKTQISLKEGTTGVAGAAFKKYGYPIALPSSLAYIGDEAFRQVSSLTEINLPNAVSIGKSAFFYCVNVTKVALADNTEIGSQAFYNDTAVTELALPYADDLSLLFGDISSTLKSYRFLAGPTSIPNMMFQNYTALTDVDFGTTIAEIGVRAFQKCTSLESVSFPDTLVTIGTRAFDSCSSLTHVAFYVSPTVNTSGKLDYNGVSSIGQLAFYNCGKLSYSTVNDVQEVSGVFMVPESIKKVAGCPFMGTAIDTIYLRIIYYYMTGVIVQTDIRDDQSYITFSKDWNSDPVRGTDSYGNPYKVPYQIVIVGND